MQTSEQVVQAIETLRHARADILESLPQAQIVQTVADWARRWQDAADPFRREAETLERPFPFSHVRISLDGLLPSLTVFALDALIDREGVRDVFGAPVVGHVIAANTPLLAWVSVLRALLMRSASFVKLPSGPAADWGCLFWRSLHAVAPKLASCITLGEWSGGTVSLDQALCTHADLMLCYGSDQTINALRALTPAPTHFIGYGHALSFGLLPDGADWETAADGFARDVLTYNQGGCLSVRTIFVQGDFAQADRFSARLHQALQKFRDTVGLADVPPDGANALATARLWGADVRGSRFYGPAPDPFVVLVWPERIFHLAGGANVVCVQPWSPGASFAKIFAPVQGHLQGCALAGTATPGLRAKIDALGVSRIDLPGTMQAPSFAWRQDRRDVLGILRASATA